MTLLVSTLVLVLAACSSPPEAAKPAEAPVPALAPAVTPAVAPAVAPAHADEHAGHAHAEAVPAAAAAPDGYRDTVAKLRLRQSEVGALLDAGKLAEIHNVAEGIVALATTLPSESAALSESNRGVVTLKALHLRQQADALHDKADAGDIAGAKAAFVQVSAAIDALAAL